MSQSFLRSERRPYKRHHESALSSPNQIKNNRLSRQIQDSAKHMRRTDSISDRDGGSTLYDLLHADDGEYDHRKDMECLF